MNTQKWILLVEDDSNDAGLALQVLTNKPSPVAVVHVKDGAEALNCLYRRDSFQARDTGPPALLLLDLKMPRVDGFAVLQQLKGDSALRAIPVTVFTSSREPSDLARSYELGTNSYVVKPLDFKAFTDVLRDIKKFWLDCNELPPEEMAASIAAQTSRSPHTQPGARSAQQTFEK
jgi:CheY-like chemotaxis protein